MTSKIPVKFYGKTGSESSVKPKKSNALSSLIDVVDDVKREVEADMDMVGVPPRRYPYKRKNITKSMPVYNTPSEQKKIKQLWMGVSVLMLCIVIIWFFVLYKSKFFSLDSVGVDPLLLNDEKLMGESIKDSYNELTRSIDVLRDQFETESLDESILDSGLAGDKDSGIVKTYGSIDGTVSKESTGEELKKENISNKPEATLTDPKSLLPEKGLIIQ